MFLFKSNCAFDDNYNEYEYDGNENGEEFEINGGSKSERTNCVLYGIRITCSNTRCVL